MAEPSPFKRERHLLGAIIAGGGSRRFGSDKALALLDGRPLLAHVVEALRSETDDLVICGRNVEGHICLDDYPAPGLGPLGGIAAALRHASERGYDAVLTSACDTPFLPDRLARRLAGEAPAFIAGQPLLGYWPASLASEIERYLQRSPDRSMRGWAQAVGAKAVAFERDIPNINHVADLAALQQLHPAR